MLHMSGFVVLLAFNLSIKYLSDLKCMCSFEKQHGYDLDASQGNTNADT